MKLFKRQSGFSVLTLILVAVVLIGVLAAAMAITRTSGTQASDTVKPVSAAIIAQGENLTAGFQILESRGIAASTVTFDSNASTGLLAPSLGAASVQSPPANGFTAGALGGIWIYKQAGIKVKGVGTGGASYGFVTSALKAGPAVSDVAAAGISLTVCQVINNQLYGDALTATPVASGDTLANWVKNASYAAPTDTGPQIVDMSAVAGVNMRMQGCVGTSDASYVYYAIAEPQ